VNQGFHVILANGDVLEVQGSPVVSWVKIGQVCDSPTSVVQSTWGQEKGTYRK